MQGCDAQGSKEGDAGTPAVCGSHGAMTAVYGRKGACLALVRSTFVRFGV